VGALADQGQGGGAGRAARAQDHDVLPLDVDLLLEGHEHARAVRGRPAEHPVVDDHGVDAAGQRGGLLHFLQVGQDLDLVGLGHAEAGQSQRGQRFHERRERLRLKGHVDGVEAARFQGPVVQDGREAAQDVAAEDAVDLRLRVHVAHAVEVGHLGGRELAGRGLRAAGGRRIREGRAVTAAEDAGEGAQRAHGQRDERGPAVVAHAGGELEQAPDVRDGLGRGHDLRDVRAHVRHLLVQAVEVEGDAFEVVVGDDEALADLLDHDVLEPAAQLDVHVVEAALHALEQGHPAAGIGVVPGPALGDGAAGEDEGARARAEDGEEVEVDDAVGADLEEVGQGRELRHAGHHPRRRLFDQRHADLRHGPHKIKKPLQGSLKRPLLVRPSRTPAPLTAAGSPGPPLEVVAVMMESRTPALDSHAQNRDSRSRPRGLSSRVKGRQTTSPPVPSP
jgi:hypothetical protein